MANKINAINLTNNGSYDSNKPWYLSNTIKLNGVSPSLVYEFDKQRYYQSGLGAIPIPYSPTRTTNATMINSVCDMSWAPANIYTRSDVGDAGWTASSSTNNIDSSVSSPTSTVVRKLIANNGITLNGNDSVGGVIAPSLTVVSGATYTFSFYAAPAGVNSVRVRESSVTGTRATIDLVTGVVTYESGSSSLTNMVISSEDAPNGFKRIICHRTASGTSQGLNIKSGNTTGDGVNGVYITSAQCELMDTTSPKQYNATTGAAYYGHRYDYNPLTLVPRLLGEPVGTNLAAQSRNAFYSGDTAFGTATAAPTALLGFGGTRLTGDGSVNSHYIIGGATAAAPAAATIHTISAYVKAGTVSLVQLTASSAFSAADVYANFNLSTGTAGSSGAGASNVTIINCGGGVYRIALTFTTTAVPAAGAAVVIAFISATTDTRLPAFASSGTLDVMGLQLETGTAYTSLIPTYGVAATRSAETFNSAVGISGWFNNAKGVIYAEYETCSPGSRQDHVFVLGKTNFTPGTEYLGFLSGYGTPSVRRFDSYVASVTQASTMSDDAIGTVNKVAGRYTASTNTIKGFKNGVSAGTNSAAPIPTALDRFILTAGYATESGIWIKKICFWPDDTASDAQMITLTDPAIF